MHLNAKSEDIQVMKENMGYFIQYLHKNDLSKYESMRNFRKQQRKYA